MGPVAGRPLGAGISGSIGWDEKSTTGLMVAGDWVELEEVVSGLDTGS